MEELTAILLEHQQRYPKMQPIDCIKLIYQNTFGGEHLIQNEEQSFQRLVNEFDALSEEGTVTNVPLFEYIGNGMYRVNLGSKELERSQLRLINRLFVVTSNKHKGSVADLKEKLAVLETLTETGKLDLDRKELQVTIEEFAEAGYPAVRHSETYRNDYSPHYRLIAEEFVNFFSVFEALEKLAAKGEAQLVAIEGRCGSGKSTLAALAQEVFDCQVFPMDDFFLPFERKTKERLAQPGGNIDYERFHEEVLTSLKKGDPVTYRPYDCTIRSLGEPIQSEAKQLTIVEGVYSLHPKLSGAYNYKIFLTVDAKIQKDRIRKRNGEDALGKFVKRWIPLEEHYFESFPIEKTCNLVIDTSRFW